MQTTATRTPAAIEKWLCEKVGELLDIEARHIDAHQPMSSFGIDSVMAMSIIGELEVWLDTDLPPDLMGDFETVADLSQFLANMNKETQR
jgi:acyl carrier protein